MTKKKFTTPLFLAASFLLIGCSSDTIVGRPAWQNDNIIEDSKGIKDNKMKLIYDAVKALGDTNANVLTKIMYDIAQNQIGSFEDLAKFGSETDETKIKQLVNTDEFKNFVNKHTVYKCSDDEEGATRSGATVTAVKLDEEQKLIVSFHKISQQYNEIVENIYEKLYDEIKGGSYSTPTTKLFREQYYIDHLDKELFDTTAKTTITPKVDKVFMPKDKDTSFKTYVNKFLNVVKVNEGILTNETTGVYDDYINRKILPELYKTYLIQTYVREQRYASLGRSYARKVNMISISATDHNKGNVATMLRYFAKKYINNISSTNHYDFEYITKAMIGFVGTNEKIGQNDNIPFQLLNYSPDDESVTSEGNFKRMYIVPSGTTTPTNNFQYIPSTDENGNDSFDSNGNPNGTPTYVYEGTKLGDLVEQIKNCCDLTVTNYKLSYTRKLHMNDSQKKVFDELTGNGAYTLAKGIAIKEREIRQTDYTKDGWFLKNGGLTDLSTTFRDNLFNIATSNQIDDYARKSDDSKKQDADYIKYFGKTDSKEEINSRKAFLTTAMPTTLDYERVVLNDNSSNNYFIVEIEEAANTSKLSEAGNFESYIRSKAIDGDTNPVNSAIKTNSLIRDIVKVNAAGDTYKNNANQYYLMISNIIFYDQSVYDYFKSQFPDLFK